MENKITPELKEAFEKILNEVYQPNEDDGVDIFTSISLSADLETHYKAMHAAYTIGSEEKEKEIQAFRQALTEIAQASGNGDYLNDMLDYKRIASDALKPQSK